MTTTSLPNWWNLDLDDAYVVDRAYSRTQHLMRGDTLVQMLSEKSILVLLSEIYFEDTGIVAGASLAVTERSEVLPAIQRVMADSALTLVNTMFVEHVAGLVADAIFPEQGPGRVEE